MKKTKPYLVASAVVFLLSACGEPDAPAEEKSSGFHTKKSSLLVVLDKDKPSKETRNAYMDAYVATSDLQCQQYLSKSLEPSGESKKENGLYMSIFDTASTIMGVKTITDGAKEIYNSASEETKKETKTAYAKALSPEIKRGVELAREEYAKTKLYTKKYKLIESYTYPMLEQDLKTYDKLCNHEVGLLEINKALKKMQKRPANTPAPFTSKVEIDPAVIASKVEKVNKEAEAKINEAAPKVNAESNATSAVAL
ncbi:MAG TPA: hypothetical protein PLH07_00235 [Sulfurovum sp.]|jgi:hypothetical protein|nr:MAG: hypothetical protein B7Y63_08065 [Sulfurovum sp. 35-42-20]OYY57467.1 MAG: hypothetical protein B7Y52_00955 [Sulfurovum sp. 28-43-6]OYZ26647.1 MAG: hypothetical protein B7Y23_01285 [Sulfurovum sp. 16-42-52]OYZ48318.1 MAG: hypothetical protein B7Y13_08015 [Sulfurovum sp. 24-42-9]OZA47069.1 MAG: hypothetical protein B7X80_00230 [Sulfurovum sp. 17-42-90]OZA61079.1 MAG: hypothetical protein B7X69_01495 [Sulfurovum sp. 39-42-12]HQR74313.1 hypothetical protein [Sulfurovum sp.]